MRTALIQPNRLLAHPDLTITRRTVDAAADPSPQCLLRRSQQCRRHRCAVPPVAHRSAQRHRTPPAIQPAVLAALDGPSAAPRPRPGQCAPCSAAGFPRRHDGGRPDPPPHVLRSPACTAGVDLVKGFTECGRGRRAPPPPHTERPQHQRHAPRVTAKAGRGHSFETCGIPPPGRATDLDRNQGCTTTASI